MKEKYYFHASWMKAIEGLPAEYQLLAVKLIHRYATDGTEPVMPGQGDPGYYMAYGIYLSAKGTIDAENAKSAARSAAARAAGQASAAARAHATATVTAEAAAVKETPQTLTQTTQTTPTPTQTTQPTPSGTGPTLEDVQAYWAQRDYNGDPVRFFDYYSQRGWAIKGQHIKYWQKVADRWAANEKTWGKSKEKEQPVSVYKQPHGEAYANTVKQSLADADTGDDYTMPQYNASDYDEDDDSVDYSGDMPAPDDVVMTWDEIDGTNEKAGEDTVVIDLDSIDRDDLPF